MRIFESDQIYEQWFSKSKSDGGDDDDEQRKKSQDSHEHREQQQQQQSQDDYDVINGLQTRRASQSSSSNQPLPAITINVQ